MGQDIAPAPPEAEVIRLARQAMDMTAQDAAEASRSQDGRGVSAAYWRDVERGYGGRRGQRVTVRASDRALAAMARVVGVQPSQLAGAGREDAARVLNEALRREGRAAPAPVIEFGEEDVPDDEYSPEERAALQDYADEFKLRVARARRRHPGERLTGLMVFPRDALYQQMWDALSQLGWKPEGLPRAMAAMMVDREDLSAGRTGTGHAAGLTAVRVT